jgi:hypothetical protein
MPKTLTAALLVLILAQTGQAPGDTAHPDAQGFPDAALGKIDVLWFDGKPAVPNADRIVTAERIRELQPGIVINPRLHAGDISRPSPGGSG